MYGARNKTRAVGHTTSKKNDNHDDGWGSIPNSSSNNNDSTWDEEWDNDPSPPTPASKGWGQDLPAGGRSERNRNHSSRSNWNKGDKDFPSLGCHQGPPALNVWERRQRNFEEKTAIQPNSLLEEEKMIQQAIELSKMETKNEEERKRQLEEEYRLQTQLLEANPDMFQEFRLCKEDFTNLPTGHVAKSKENFANEYVTEGETGFEGAWGVSSTAAVKEKGSKKTEISKVDEPSLKPKRNYDMPQATSNYKPHVPKVVDLFGGWGSLVPCGNKKDAKKKLPSRSNHWETVDTNFVSKLPTSCKVEGKPDAKPFSSSLEVKLENASAWDDLDDLKPVAVETQNYLGTCDTFEMNKKDSDWYSLDQKDKEFSSQSSKKKSQIKADTSSHNQGSSLPMNKEAAESSHNEQRGDPSENCDRISWEKSNQEDNRTKPQCLADGENADAKTEVGSLKKECSDPHMSVKKDYAFLLDHINSNNTKADSGENGENNAEPIKEKVDVFIKKTQDQVKDMLSTEFSIGNLPGPTTEEPFIPDPKPIENQFFSSTNQKFLTGNIESPSGVGINPLNTFESNSYDTFQIPSSNDDVPTFGGYPTKSESPTLPVFNETSLLDFKDMNTLPTFSECQTNLQAPTMPEVNDGSNHIPPPQAPSSEFSNPALFMQPRSMMAPMMNPALMMGMNPLMQQMMLNNSFFMQQWQQMYLYYQSMGMSIPMGMPVFPQQPMALPFGIAPNFQNIGNTNLVGVQNAFPCGDLQSNPNTLQSAKLSEPSTQPSWFEDFISPDASTSSIPPPMPSPIDAPINPEVLQGALASMSVNAAPQETPVLQDQLTKSAVEDLPTSCSAQDPFPNHGKTSDSESVTGWGDIDADSRSECSTGWNDGMDGWGSDATSMRKPSGNKANSRQPTSRPNLGRQRK